MVERLNALCIDYGVVKQGMLFVVWRGGEAMLFVLIMEWWRGAGVACWLMGGISTGNEGIGWHLLKFVTSGRRGGPAVSD